jgi:hypothetical protein
MTMAQARSAHPEIAKSRFVQSGVDFDLYISGMCWTSSRPIAALWFMLHSMTHDPLNWRHGAGVLRDLARRLFARWLEDPNDAAVTTRTTFHGQAFSLLQPDAQCDLCQAHPVNITAIAS